MLHPIDNSRYRFHALLQAPRPRRPPPISSAIPSSDAWSEFPGDTPATVHRSAPQLPGQAGEHWTPLLSSGSSGVSGPRSRDIDKPMRQSYLRIELVSCQIAARAAASQTL